jgi:Ca-activated chloride channel family protein
MDVVTDAGRGAYVYLDSVQEAQAIFTERFDEVMEVAARGVNLELTLPWYFQMHQFFGEEYSTDPKEVEAQHLAPSDVMVFNQVLKACDASVVNTADEVTVKATWETPLTREPRMIEHTASIGELLGGDKTQLKIGKAIVAYAEALKSGEPAAIEAAFQAIAAADPEGTNPMLGDIEALLGAHPAAAELDP